MSKYEAFMEYLTSDFESNAYLQPIWPHQHSIFQARTTTTTSDMSLYHLTSPIALSARYALQSCCGPVLILKCQNCATVSYLYIGTTNSSSGSCCTAQLNFAALDASPQSGTILTFNREGDWTCFNGDELTLDPSLLDSYFELSFPITDSVSWSWNDMTLETSTQSLYTCSTYIVHYRVGVLTVFYHRQ